MLANRDGNKLGVIPALHINVGDHLNDAMELQFVVQKEYNGLTCALWDEIVDFKLVWCPEWDAWFEIHVEAKDSESVFKNINAVALGEAELSQINLYNIEINTETDIANDDYVVTVLYDENNPKASLLNRISEKIPHYSIGHVDSSIASIQRTFSFDGTTILDALNSIAEEIDCLFVIDNGSDANGKPARTINAYDLESVCRSCGYRGVFTGKCPECDSDDVSYGYGEDTNIYVSSENLSDEITYTSNVDQVKNCFRLVGGDDLMTAAIASCNPNGSGYMWYFSDAMKEDMSDELRTKLAEYNAEYTDYVNNRQFSLPVSLVSDYNALINKYKAYRSTLPTISNPVAGYANLINAYYDAIDFEMLLRNELMPSIEIAEKTAQTEAAKLTSANLSPTAVTDLQICSLATATSAVQSVAKQWVDGNFQVKAEGISFNKPTWRGTLTVTNYSDEEDTASTTVSVTITDDKEAYLSQRINKILADGDSDIVDISDLFKADLNRFTAELKKYCLVQLNSMRDICQSCLDILIENGVADDGERTNNPWAGTDSDVYQQLYLPYYNKLNALIVEVALREEELAIITGVFDEGGGVVQEGIQTAIVGLNAGVQAHLDFEEYLGSALTKQLAAYRRDDTYQNDNFISDGLNNAELIARAQEFIELAKKEIYKSATLQHSITSSLKNLLVMKEFSDLTEQFAVGNWLTVGVAGKPYRLRLVSYEIDFDDLENINVEFSDVIQTGYGASDIESILKSAASMSTSFGSVKRQAKRGGNANKTLNEYKEQGLALTNMKIVSSADNQNVTMDQHGILLRELVPYNEEYDERQMKFINRGLYLTKDGWRTTTAGIGDFIYYDPEDGEMKEDYGVVADVLMGNYILGEKFGIYNEGSTVKIDKNGLTIIATPESEEGAGDSTVFKIQRATEGGNPQNVIWFESDGKAHFNGTIEVTSSVGDTTIGDMISSMEGAITGVDVEYCQNQSKTEPPDEDDKGWQTEAPEWRSGYYIWQRTATTTADGTTYSDPVCISGRDGDSGMNTATITLYQRSSTQPSKPSVAAGFTTYTFANKTLSPIPSDWSMSIPSGDDPCWASAATAVSTTATDEIGNSEWTTPVKLVENGANGANGLNQATIMLYQRATSTPSKPSVNVTYTFATGELNTIPTGWSRNIPDGDSPCYVTSAVAISSEATDVIVGTPASANEWSDVTKMVENGISATVYGLSCSPAALVRNQDGTLQPSSITFSATQTQGTGTPSTYAGRFKIDEYNGSAWTTKFTSSSNQSSKSYSPTDTAKLVRATLYKAGGTTTQLDTQTVPIVSEGGYGADAYTVLLSNEAHTFPAGEQYAVNGSSATSQIIAYKGKEQIAATIGTITVPSGMSKTIPSAKNGTTNAEFTITISSTTFSQSDGVITIPVTVDDDVQFSLKFSWSLAFTGPKGDPGDNGVNTATLMLYQRSDSTPAVPSGNIEYTFESASITSGSIGNWTLNSLPAINPCYMTAACAVSAATATTDSIAAAEWFTPIQMDDTRELNRKVILLYRRYSSTPSKPSGTVTYTFSTDELSSTPTNWSRTIPSGTNTLYVSAAVAVSYEDSVSIASSNWSAVASMASGDANIAMVSIYQRAASSPTKPSSALTYTFATKALSGTVGNWTTEYPSVKPCWVTAATASSTDVKDTIGTGEWSTPVKMTEDGTSGLNQATIYLYKRSASEPSKPSSTVTYDFVSGNLSSNPSGWSRDIPTGTDPCWITSAVAISTEDVDSILPSEWADVAKLAENGINGTNGANGVGIDEIIELYNRAATKPNKPDAGGTGWQSTPYEWLPGQYIWTCSKITWSDGDITYTDVVEAKGINKANETAYTADGKAVAFRGVLNTSASTAAKTVTCANFSLAEGVSITVLNKTANTSAGELTLNVNSTGAKKIYVAGAVTSGTNQLLWAANSTVTYTYDGTQWRVETKPGKWYSDACGTSAATAAKTAAVNEIVVFKGTEVDVMMTNGNTTSSQTTLNLGSVGAKNVYFGSTSTNPTSYNNGKYSWIAGVVTTFTFDGQYWRMALTQTIIDGARIITGSVTAQQIDATNLHVSAANVDGTLKLGGTDDSNGTMEVYAAGATTPSCIINNTGFSFRYDDNCGMQIGPYGDLAIGAKVSNLSSFDSNKCAFQVNNSGVIKAAEIQLWGRDSSTSNYTKKSQIFYDNSSDQKAFVFGSYETGCIAVKNNNIVINAGTNDNPVELFGQLTFSDSLSGGSIAYTGGGSKVSMIRFKTGNSSGHGIIIGGGGLTVIGGGDNTDSVASLYAGDNEYMCVCSDADIKFFTNAQNGANSATVTNIDVNGNFSGNAANVTGTVAIANGGTGATSRTVAYDNLAYLGSNITGGTSNDTREFWQNKGNGYAYFSTNGQVVGQPGQWGFIINHVIWSEVHQEWFMQGKGHYYRVANGSTTTMPEWTRILDEACMLAKNVTGTTNGNGNFSLGISAIDYNILSVQCNSHNSYAALPYRYNNTWYVHLFNAASASYAVLANTSSVEVYCSYIEAY